MGAQGAPFSPRHLEVSVDLTNTGTVAGDAVKAQQLAYWDADRKALVVEPQPVRLLIGASSADVRLRAGMTVQ